MASPSAICLLQETRKSAQERPKPSDEASLVSLPLFLRPRPHYSAPKIAQLRDERALDGVEQNVLGLDIPASLAMQSSVSYSLHKTDGQNEERTDR